jgi:hypothetical protein
LAGIRDRQSQLLVPDGVDRPLLHTRLQLLRDENRAPSQRNAAY